MFHILPLILAEVNIHSVAVLWMLTMCVYDDTVSNLGDCNCWKKRGS